MKKLIVLLTLLSFSAMAMDVRYPAIVVTKGDNNISIFEKCYAEGSCNTIGRDAGYDFSDVKLKPGMRKARAIGTGAAEVLAAIVVGYIAAWGVYAAAGIGTSDWALLMAGIAAGGGSVGALSFLINKINPVYQWKLSNVEKDLKGINMVTEGEKMAIEFPDVIKMEKYAKVLLNKLQDLERRELGVVYSTLYFVPGAGFVPVIKKAYE